MRHLVIILFLLMQLFIHTTAAVAADDILIRSKATPDNPWPGQKVVLKLDVLVADGWVQVKKFPNVQLDSGYLIRFESQGTRLNETIDGKSYSGQRYEFFFFPQYSGNVSIPPMPLDIEIKKWGGKPAQEIVKKNTPQITLAVKKYPGEKMAERMISTTNYSVIQSWEPSEDSLKVGDAVTRRITLQAVDVSSMLFTPLHFPDIEGIGIYPKQPEIKDSYERGELKGKRVEEVSYVVEKPGTFQLPEMQFSWWEIKEEKLKEIVLPGRSLTVSGEALSAIDTQSKPVQQLNKRLLYTIGSALFLLVLAIFYYRKQLISFYFKQLKLIQESEQKLFRSLHKAAQSNDPALLLQLTMKWLDYITPPEQPPARLDLFLLRYGNPRTVQLAEQLLNFKLSVESKQEIKQFFKGMKRARKQWRNEQRHSTKAEQLLPRV
ncbi:MAG: hypothetical protein ABFR31_01210 [Thermodesulfobacteriota bacterium]